MTCLSCQSYKLTSADIRGYSHCTPGISFGNCGYNADKRCQDVKIGSRIHGLGNGLPIGHFNFNLHKPLKDGISVHMSFRISTFFGLCKSRVLDGKWNKYIVCEGKLSGFSRKKFCV